MNINDEIDVMEFSFPDDFLIYLYYGDRSVLTDNEVAIVDQWYDDNFTGLIGHIVVVKEIGFLNRHCLRKYGILSCECTLIHYVVMGHSSNE